METNKIIKELEEEFEFVYLWEDPSNFKYEEHQHEGKTCLIILEGNADFKYTDTNEEIKLQAGMKFYPEAKRNHIATVGENGWKIIVGEEIDGDS